MKTMYQFPELEVLKYEEYDVLTTSNIDDDEPGTGDNPGGNGTSPNN